MNGQTLISEAFVATESVPPLDRGPLTTEVSDYLDWLAEVATSGFNDQQGNSGGDVAVVPAPIALPPRNRASISSTCETEACQKRCHLNGTKMCVQSLLTAQALMDHRVSLGVLCGLKRVYYPHDLPPCIVGDIIDWTRPDETRDEMAFA